MGQMGQRSEADRLWDAAIRHVLGDVDGTSIRTSQALWARAVREELADAHDVRCAGDVLGPVLTPNGFVVSRPSVAVRSDDPHRARAACDAAWLRFARVDDDGIEVDEEWFPDAPDAVGYPVVHEGLVVLGFDGRADDEPFPHRGRTCLRILVDELRRHGCVPVELINPVRLPDDDGVDVETLAERLGAHPGVGTDAGAAGAAPDATRPGSTGTASGRPAWLPPFHRVERASTGTPSGPVPFVLLAAGWAWAWDTDAGLLELPGRSDEEPGHLVFPMEALAPDGTRLRYVRYPGHRPTSPPAGMVVRDLASGAAELATGPSAQTFEAGPQGPYLYATPPRPAPDGSHTGARYDLVGSAGAPPRTLALDDLLVVSHDGAAAQFSPSGRLLLTGHVRIGDSSRYVAWTELSTGRSRLHENVTIAGSVSWSPDETRCLVRNGSSRWVLDLATGATTRVPTWPIGTQPADRRSEARPLAWLGEDGLLVSQAYGKRVELAYQPLDGTTRYPVLDLPVAGRAGDALGVVLAADVVHRSPWLVGKREATPDD